MGQTMKFTNLLLATVFTVSVTGQSVPAAAFGNAQLGGFLDTIKDQVGKVPQGMNNQQSGQSSGDRIDEEEDESDGDGNTGLFGNIIQAGKNIGGGVLANRVCSGKASAISPVCRQLMQQTADILGEEIARMLTPKDQRKVVAASQEALSTGKPVTVDLPDSEATTTIKPVGKVKKQKKKVPIVVEKDAPIEPHQIDLDVANYSAKSNTNLRAGPSTDKPVVGSIAGGEVVSVAGTVVGTNWLLVTRTGVAAGYASKPLLKPTSKQVKSNPGKSRETEVVQVPVITNCGKQEITVESKKTGETAKTTKTVCESPNGNVIAV